MIIYADWTLLCFMSVLFCFVYVFSCCVHCARFKTCSMFSVLTIQLENFHAAFRSAAVCRPSEREARRYRAPGRRSHSQSVKTHRTLRPLPRPLHGKKWCRTRTGGVGAHAGARQAVADWVDSADHRCATERSRLLTVRGFPFAHFQFHQSEIQ